MYAHKRCISIIYNETSLNRPAFGPKKYGWFRGAASFVRLLLQKIVWQGLTRVPPTVQNTLVKSLKKLWSWPLSNDLKKESELFSPIMKNHCLIAKSSCLSIRFSYKVILWTWPFTNDIGSRSWSKTWHFLGSSLTIL
jgi:hypothetical protein